MKPTLFLFFLAISTTFYGQFGSYPISNIDYTYSTKGLNPPNTPATIVAKKEITVQARVPSGKPVVFRLFFANKINEEELGQVGLVDLGGSFVAYTYIELEDYDYFVNLLRNRRRATISLFKEQANSPRQILISQRRL